MTRAPHDLQQAYADADPGGKHPAVSEVERALMADTFLAVDAQAPTLSGPWDAHHLVAHLVLRESNPVGAVRAALPRAGDEAVEGLVRKTGYAELVERFRNGPPALSFFRLPANDRRLNAIEHFIHHEDVRRAQPDWARRDLPTWAQDQLWSPLRWFAKGVTRHSPTALNLARTDTGEESVARKGDDPVVLHGLPSELALYVYGRSPVADVELDGAYESVERLRSKRFRF
jgi:uncharacterized protein (TIGR03085 family)